MAGEGKAGEAREGEAGGVGGRVSKRRGSGRHSYRRWESGRQEERQAAGGRVSKRQGERKAVGMGGRGIGRQLEGIIMVHS